MNQLIVECRKAFEGRRIPNLDLKRDGDGGYHYQAAQLAFRDFADGWSNCLIFLLENRKMSDESYAPFDTEEPLDYETLRQFYVSIVGMK